LTAYTRVSTRSSPGVRHPRARRARPSNAHKTKRPGSDGNGVRSGRYHRRLVREGEEEHGCSSGTASARRGAAGAARSAYCEALAARLESAFAAARRTVSRHREIAARARARVPSDDGLQLAKAYSFAPGGAIREDRRWKTGVAPGLSRFCGEAGTRYIDSTSPTQARSTPKRSVRIWAREAVRRSK